MAERRWYRNAVEGLFVRGLADVHSPALRAALAEVGLRLDRLDEAYPASVFLDALTVAGPFVAPGASAFEQQRALGVRFTRGYFATPLGAALSLALRLVGPLRGMARVGSTYRTVTNYLDARAVTLEPGYARLEFAPAGGLAPFLLGNGEASFSMLHRGAATSVVELEEGERVVVSVRWS